MAKVAVNTPAPAFQLADFRGEPISLADYQGEKNVLLVFNRGFV